MCSIICRVCEYYKVLILTLGGRNFQYRGTFHYTIYSTLYRNSFFFLDLLDSECIAIFCLPCSVGEISFFKNEFDDTFYLRSIGRLGVEWIFSFPRICIISFTIHFSFPLNETDWLWELDPSSSVSCHVVPCNWYPLFDKISGWFDLIPIRFEYPRSWRTSLRHN